MKIGNAESLIPKELLAKIFRTSVQCVRKEFEETGQIEDKKRSGMFKVVFGSHALKK